MTKPNRRQHIFLMMYTMAFSSQFSLLLQFPTIFNHFSLSAISIAYNMILLMAFVSPLFLSIRISCLNCFLWKYMISRRYSTTVRSVDYCSFCYLMMHNHMFMLVPLLPYCHTHTVTPIKMSNVRCIECKRLV